MQPTKRSCETILRQGVDETLCLAGTAAGSRRRVGAAGMHGEPRLRRLRGRLARGVLRAVAGVPSTDPRTYASCSSTSTLSRLPLLVGQRRICHRLRFHRGAASIAVLPRHGCAGHPPARALSVCAAPSHLGTKSTRQKAGRDTRRTHAFAIPSDRRIRARND